LPDRSRQKGQKGRRRFLPFNYRGLIFDLAVFVFNVFLVRLVTRHVGRLLSLTYLGDDPRAARSLLYVVSAASAAQLFGAWLKRRPLQTRMLMRGEDVPGAFGCLLVFHFALTFVTNAGLAALLSSEPSSGAVVFVFFLSMIPTVLVWRALTPYKKPPARDWRGSRAAEAAADICLFAYMLVNLAIWNTLTSGANLPASGPGDLAERALGFLILSPVILLFYIPPRLLFLVEDYKYRFTWVSMTIAVAPVAYRIIYGVAPNTDW
jgi:hypothetical protein